MNLLFRAHSIALLLAFLTQIPAWSQDHIHLHPPPVAIDAAATPLATPLATPSDQLKIWRQANDLVGKIRATPADMPPAEPAPSAQGSVDPSHFTHSTRASSTLANPQPLNTAEAAIRLAWQTHPELGSQLALIGSDQRDHIATGQWEHVNVPLLHRIEDSQGVLQLSYQVRKAWLQAVAAKQMQVHLKQAQVAVEASAELAQRMAKVGNWSALQQANEQIQMQTIQMQTLRGQYETQRLQAGLMQLLRLWGTDKSVTLPEQLPPLPDQALSEAALQTRLNHIQNQLPLKEKMRNSADAMLAQSAHRTALTLAKLQQNEVLPLRQRIMDETILRYNGMLASVWDVLAQSLAQSQAANSAILAQRDFWLADADLQWVLIGVGLNHFANLSNATEP